MNYVYIVLRNGKVDAVFYNKEAAENHRFNLNKLWAISEVIKKRYSVYELVAEV